MEINEGDDEMNLSAETSENSMLLDFLEMFSRRVWKGWLWVCGVEVGNVERHFRIENEGEWEAVFLNLRGKFMRCYHQRKELKFMFWILMYSCNSGFWRENMPWE